MADLFGTHIREAIETFRKKPSQPQHQHCDHDTGNGSGSMSFDGSGHSDGENVCCHCGRRERYSIKWPARAPITHGPYLP